MNTKSSLMMKGVCDFTQRGSVQTDRGGLSKQTEGVCSNGQTNIEPYIEPYIDIEQDKNCPAPSSQSDTEGDTDTYPVNTKKTTMTAAQFAEQHANRKKMFQKKGGAPSEVITRGSSGRIFYPETDS